MHVREDFDDMPEPASLVLDGLNELQSVLDLFSNRGRNSKRKAASKSVVVQMDALIYCIREINTSNSNPDSHNYCLQVIESAKSALQKPTQENIDNFKLYADESRIPKNILPSLKQKIIGLVTAIVGCLAIVGSIFLAKMAIASSVTPPGMGFGLLASVSAYQGCSWVKNGLSYFSFFGGNGARKEIGDKINDVSRAFNQLI